MPITAVSSLLESEEIKLPNGTKITHRPIFPLKSTRLYKSLKSSGRLKIISGVETYIENNERQINTLKEQIDLSIENIRKNRRGTEQLTQKVFSPLKQAEDNETHRTCVAATAVNALRAMGNKSITEDDLLKDIDPSEFDANGQLRGDILNELLEKNGMTVNWEANHYNPESIVNVLSKGGVIMTMWESHARLVSGMFNKEDGEVFLIVNDPLPEEPDQYAVNLKDFCTISQTWDQVSMATVYKKEADT